MLIKITTIEEECSDLEEIVDDLKKRINRMLREEEKDKVSSKERHEEEVSFMSKDNQSFMQQLKTILTTFEEAKKEDE